MVAAVEFIRRGGRLWVALAEAEQELGISISADQVESLRSAVDNIDFAPQSSTARQHALYMTSTAGSVKPCHPLRPRLHARLTSMIPVVRRAKFRSAFLIQMDSDARSRKRLSRAGEGQ